MYVHVVICAQEMHSLSLFLSCLGVRENLNICFLLCWRLKPLSDFIPCLASTTTVDDWITLWVVLWDLDVVSEITVSS